MFLLFYLEYHEADETDLARLLGIARASVSKHLHLMLRYGLLRSERRGGSVYFTMHNDFRPMWQEWKKLFAKDAKRRK